VLDWIVCLGAERPVADMRVVCPTGLGAVATAEVPVEECLRCRHLLATAVDRIPTFMCSVDSTTDPD
jgi:hypothetical protein